MTGRYRSPKLLASFGLLLSMTLAPEAFARGSDIAPAPSRAPRTAVHQQVLGGSKAPAAPPRFVEGPAVTLDNEHIRIGDVDLRLFGIVPPQLSAPFGPQTRSLLDSLIGTGFISCTIKDRERDGRLLASCKSAHSGDFALDLLRRGLAVTARGSLRGSDLLSTYLAAEQAAQTQRLGLWSVKVPTAASDSSIRDAAQVSADKAAAATKEAAEAKLAKEEQPVKPELQPDVSVLTAKAKAEPEAPKAPEPKATDNPKTTDTLSPVALPASALKPGAGTKLPVETKQQIPVLADALQAEIAAALDDTQDDNAASDPSSWTRYQFLLGCLVLALTGFGVTAGRAWNNARARRAARRDVADALMGELTAARATCGQRLSQLQTGNASASAGFPRLRAIVFQAYANRLGLLGPVLSRQIGSIYGQAADYAAYFNVAPSSEGAVVPRPHDAEAKKQALETLIGYIDAVLPQLAINRKIVVNKQIAAKRRGYGRLKGIVKRTAQASAYALFALFRTFNKALKSSVARVQSSGAKTFAAIQAIRAAQAAARQQKEIAPPPEVSLTTTQDAIQTDAPKAEAGQPSSQPAPDTSLVADQAAAAPLPPLPSFAPQFIDLNHPSDEPETTVPTSDALQDAAQPTASTLPPERSQDKDQQEEKPALIDPTASIATAPSPSVAPQPEKGEDQPRHQAPVQQQRTKRATAKNKQGKAKTSKTASKDKATAPKDQAESDGETLWVKLRHLAQMHAHARPAGKNHDLDDGFYATYGGLTPEEIEALAFGDTPVDDGEMFAASLPLKQGKH